MMHQNDAVKLLKAMNEIGISVWIDGGWGVDALIGFQTRPHNDIDIFIEVKNTDNFINLIQSQDYYEVKMDYTTAGHTVWQDPFDRIIDLHLFSFKDSETICFNNEDYPANVLDGYGSIGGLPARCFTPEAQLLYHQGYEHKEKDVHDVHWLCKTFGFNIPAQYQKISIAEKGDKPNAD